MNAAMATNTNPTTILVSLFLKVPINAIQRLFSLDKRAANLSHILAYKRRFLKSLSEFP
jgi:hypothetical protein